MTKNKGMLIVMEGACDGIGKSTQFKKLYDRLIQEGYSVVSHHFPSYNTYHGAPVEKYLAGDLGDVKSLSPYFVNSLYAVDRACAWYSKLKEEYEQGKIILLDRYTTSSIIYQSSVIDNLCDRRKFINYIEDYEYQKIGIAKPDMVIFLEAPFDLVTEMRQNRTDYEGNKEDIHERNLKFMKSVYDNALFVADYLKWNKIKCNKGGKMCSIDEIHKLIVSEVKKKINT